MKVLVKAIDSKIKEFQKDKKLKKVTYNIGFVQGLNYAKELIKDREEYKKCHEFLLRRGHNEQ